MPRPSKKEERSLEILQAYERCIAMYGVEGATLQKIADEANIARPLLRHNIGNSNDLLDKAIERYLKRSTESTQELVDYFSNSFEAEEFINVLFTAETDQNDVMIATAFIVASQTDIEIKKKMDKWFKDFRKKIFNLLKKFHSDKNEEYVQVVTDGIVGIYFNVESLAPIGNTKSLRKSSKKAALILLKTLSHKG